MVEEVGGGASRTTDPAAGSSAATDISLREYLEALRRGDSDRSRERLAWLLAIGLFGWSQVQRRLEILNHENARVAVIAEKTVSGDTYKSDEERRADERTKLDGWRKEVDLDRSRSITRDEFQRDTKQESRSSIDTTTKVIVAVVGALVLGLGILNYVSLHHSQVAPVVTVTIPATTTPSG